MLQTHYFTEKAILALYFEMRGMVEETLKRAQQAAFTPTTRATETYVTITVYFIDKEWHSCLLQMKAMHQSHTGAHIVLQKAT